MFFLYYIRQSEKLPTPSVLLEQSHILQMFFRRELQTCWNQNSTQFPRRLFKLPDRSEFLSHIKSGCAKWQAQHGVLCLVFTFRAVAAFPLWCAEWRFISQAHLRRLIACNRAPSPNGKNNDRGQVTEVNVGSGYCMCSHFISHAFCLKIRLKLYCWPSAWWHWSVLPKSRLDLKTSGVCC